MTLKESGKVRKAIPAEVVPVDKDTLLALIVAGSMFSKKDTFMKALMGTLVAPLPGPVRVVSMVGATVSIVNPEVLVFVGLAPGVLALQPIWPG